jgi:uncharacterized protein (TIGR03382 family)
MRGSLVGIAIATALASTGARADCNDAGASPDGCRPGFSVALGALPSVTGAPLLEIDAVIQDNGATLIQNPNAAVFVTVRGDGADGGGVILQPDGGFGTSPGPFIAPLSVGTFTSDGGVFASSWDGGASLFLGSNTIVVSAVKPSGERADSAPQIVRLTPSFDGGGADAGTTTDGGFFPDGGPASQAALRAEAPVGESSQGCTTTGGPPSFLLMALGVIFAGLGRRAMRG